MQDNTNNKPDKKKINRLVFDLKVDREDDDFAALELLAGIKSDDAELDTATTKGNNEQIEQGANNIGLTTSNKQH